jgi:hypothetical protein
MTTLTLPLRQPAADIDIPSIMGGLYRDGIIARTAAFSREWAERIREDIERLFGEALTRPGGTVGRGPKRYYSEIHPEDIRGFLDLVTHPWVTTVCEAILGPDYRIVEIGYDVPLPGSAHQPWHRDFPVTDATRVGRRLNSLAFNVTGVDVTEEMGPLEIAPGTQWDDATEYAHGMFPPTSLYDRYADLTQRKMPQLGDISARTALTIHRGTPNRSTQPRPVLVLGVDAPDARNAERHDLQVTRTYFERLPLGARTHLSCRLVDQLEPIAQAHTIEGLIMGAA